MAYNTKQYHTRRLKPLKHVLDPTLYQFMLWTTNQKWWFRDFYEFGLDNKFNRIIVYSLWKKN